LEQACVEVYEDGFLKAIRQATVLAPDIDPALFDIDKDDVLAADPIPDPWFLLPCFIFYIAKDDCMNFINLFCLIWLCMYAAYFG